LRLPVESAQVIGYTKDGMAEHRTKRSMWIAIGVVAGSAALAVVIVAMLFGTGVLHLPEPPVAVPNISSLDVPTARSRLAEVGLELKKGDSRFSASVPAGAVIEQDPAAGTLLGKGSVVTVAVSAGSEKFAMPDVTGLPVAAALDALQAKGLAARVEKVDSRLASGTVIATVPSPGQDVSTADIVKVRVSAGDRGGALLLPYDFKGKTFVIDPEPTPGPADPGDEVGRRLRSLLEASGAKVVVTRSIAATNPPSTQRQLVVMETSSTAIVGLSAPKGGPGGIVLGTVASQGRTSSFFLKSVDLQTRALADMTEGGLKASAGPAASDPVFQTANAPGIRVHLGSQADKADARNFTDANWIDLVARAVYRGLGETFAPRPDAAAGVSTPATSSAVPTPSTSTTP
jgi:flagellar basal body-associated protein FliL